MKQSNSRDRVQIMNNKKYILLYVILIIFTSVPIINDFLFRGHDVYFHLMRIEGLAEGLKCGQFPVKIQPVWYGDYGYAVSVFYGDLFVYVAAFLRLAGLSLQNAYKSYLLCCNIATVLISGYSFGRIFDNKNIGIFASFIYSMSVYRFVNLYTRGAVGEYTGMIFTPLIIYACVLLLSKEKEDKDLNKGTLILGIGMACIIQSHILTAEIVCIVLCMVVVLFIKRVANKKVIFAGLKAVGITIGLSLWFLVPFLDYMINGEYNINSLSKGELLIQRQGVFLSQMLALFDNAVGESLDLSAGVQGDFAQGAGLIFVLAIPAFIVICCLYYKNKSFIKEKGQAVTAAIIGLAMLLMSSLYFPWDYICRLGAIFRYVVVNIQFPWRFTGIAVAVLTFLWCANISIVLKNSGKKKAVLLSGIVISIAAISLSGFMADLFDRAQRIQINSVQDMDSFVASGEEYIPLNTVLDKLKFENLKSDADILVRTYRKNGTNINFYCENNSNDDAEIELPLLYYEGYKAVAEGSDNKKHSLEVRAGNNNVLKVIIEPNLKSEVEIYFSEPWYWRIAEMVSLIMFTGILLNFGRRKCKIWS